MFFSKRNLSCLILPIFFILGILFSAPATAAFKYLSEGMQVPDVHGNDIITGEQISSRKLCQDNLVIITFWSTWSKRSLTELTELKEIVSEYSQYPVKIIAINVDKPKLSGPAREAVIKLVKELDLPFSILIDKDFDFFYQFGVIAVPSTAIFDSANVLKYGPAGYSLTTRDRIIDSIRVFFGLTQITETELPTDSYQPKKRASRFYNLALNLSRMRMYERALSNLDTAETVDNLFAAPHNLRGEIYLKLNKIDSALNSFKKAVSLDSNLVAAWAGSGKASLTANNYDSSIFALSKALALDENYTPAHLDLGLCLAAMGDSIAAIDSLNRAVELNQADPRGHYYLGKVYLKLSNHAKATESFLNALHLLFPND